jgi:hypothetical protein
VLPLAVTAPEVEQFPVAMVPAEPFPAPLDGCWAPDAAAGSRCEPAAAACLEFQSGYSSQPAAARKARVGALAF